MAGRRTSLASLAGQKVDDVPGKSDPLLLSLPLDKLVPTRFNPRRRFGTDEELREFGQKLAREQLQPAVVVSKAAYLKLWPEEADHVGDASYVIANGERRYRASRLVGRPVLEVVHKEDVASSRATFLDAVQSENNDRENLDPIERALGIDIMVTQLGGADQVAVYYRKTKGWVSQQRKLLKLTPELQDLVSVGEMPIRVARDIAGLPPEVQATAWEEELERRRLEKEAGARLRAQAESPTVPLSSPPAAPALPSPPAQRNTEPTPQPHPQGSPPRQHIPAVPAGSSPAGSPVGQGQPDPGSPGVPERNPEPAASSPEAPRRFPYEDGQSAARHLILKMPPDQLELVTRLLLQHAQEHGLNVAPDPVA